MPVVGNQALSTQGMVLWALILREIHTIYGGDRLGYLWVLLNTAFGVGIFWGIRVLVGAKMPHGIPIPVYLLAGFAVWRVFNDTILKCMSAESGNKPLLTFPQVTLLDIMVSRAVVITSTQMVVTALMLVLAVLLGYRLPWPNWGGVFGVLVLTFGLSLGLGILLTLLNKFLPVVNKIVPLVLRVMFFLSGVFFSLNNLPYGWRRILWGNPIMQLIEWLRSSLTPGYQNPAVNPGYLIALALVVLTLGLILERYTRKYTINQ